jgi:hypothetical protein
MICNVFNSVTNECIDTFDFDEWNQLGEFLSYHGYFANSGAFFFKIYS